MNKYVKLVLILAIAAVIIGALYWWFTISERTGNGTTVSTITGTREEITSPELALTLLTGEEAAQAASLQGSLIPRIPQMNNRLAADDAAKYGYQDLVARVFVGKQAKAEIIENALTLFETDAQTVGFLEAKAAEAGNATITRSFGGTVPTLTLVSQGSRTESVHATMRFAIGRVVARITVHGDNDTIQMKDTGLLAATAQQLATVQKAKIEQLLAGNTPGVKALEQSNLALMNLPTEIAGAELIGKLPMSEAEWLTETGSISKSAIEGFVSGAVARFRLPSIPGSYLEVVVIEYENTEAAKQEPATFFSGGAHAEDPTSKPLDLPASLKDSSVARVSDTLAELQAVRQVYLYDLVIQSPFADSFNREAAAAALVKAAESFLR